MSTIEKLLEKQKRELIPVTLGSLAGQAGKNGRIDQRIVTYHKSDVLIVEHFRQIKRILQAYRETTQASLFTFTSAMRGEGTSTLLVNLAATFRNGSACLVDANLVQPSIHRLLGISNEIGLANVLAGTNDLRDALSKCPSTEISVLTAGKDKNVHPEAIASQGMHNILLELKKDFEYVLIDAPPILVTSDSVTLCAMVDGVVLVVDYQRGKKKPVKRALEMLHSCNVLGFILCKDTNIAYDYIGLSARDKKWIQDGVGK
ncbi:MAG TPA: CpsD/CapB family tyrosine-protein kinase [Candidatus Hypogeohydataceae bacterium YC41]